MVIPDQKVFKKLFYCFQSEHNSSYFAVFDGHCGVDAAKYCVSNLLVNIVRHPSYPKNLEKVLKEAIEKTDVNFLRRAKAEVGC